MRITNPVNTFVTLTPAFFFLVRDAIEEFKRIETD